MVTNFKAAAGYILEIITNQCKTDCSIGRCGSWKKFPWTCTCGSYQQNNLINIGNTKFQMMKKSCFIMVKQKLK